MSGFQSQAGHVIFKTQTGQGVFNDPAVGGVAMKTRSGGLGGNRDLMIPDPEIGGSRDIPDALLGPVGFAGEFEFYARLNSLATLLKGALGSATSTTAGAGPTLVGTHVIKAIDTAALPWLSVEEKVGDGLDAFRYTDTRVNTLHLEADAKGYLMGTAGLVALTQTAIGGASATPAPAFDNTELIVGSNITLAFGGVQLPAKSFKFDLNNNIEDDDFRLGSLFLGDAVPKRRELSLGATVRPSNRDMWRQAMYGDASRSTAGGVVTKDDVRLICQSYAVIGSSLTVFLLDFDIGKAAIKPFEQKPSGDDIIQYDLELQVLRPDPAVDLLTCTVKNGLATVV